MKSNVKSQSRPPKNSVPSPSSSSKPWNFVSQGSIGKRETVPATRSNLKKSFSKPQPSEPPNLFSLAENARPKQKSDTSSDGLDYPGKEAVDFVRKELSGIYGSAIARAHVDYMESLILERNPSPPNGPEITLLVPYAVPKNIEDLGELGEIARGLIDPALWDVPDISDPSNFEGKAFSQASVDLLTSLKGSDKDDAQKSVDSLVRSVRSLDESFVETLTAKIAALHRRSMVFANSVQMLNAARCSRSEWEDYYDFSSERLYRFASKVDPVFHASPCSDLEMLDICKFHDDAGKDLEVLAFDITLLSAYALRNLKVIDAAGFARLAKEFRVEEDFLLKRAFAMGLPFDQIFQISDSVMFERHQIAAAQGKLALATEVNSVEFRVVGVGTPETKESLPKSYLQIEDEKKVTDDFRNAANAGVWFLFAVFANEVWMRYDQSIRENNGLSESEKKFVNFDSKSAVEKDILVLEALNMFYLVRFSDPGLDREGTGNPVGSDPSSGFVGPKFGDSFSQEESADQIASKLENLRTKMARILAEAGGTTSRISPELTSRIESISGNDVFVALLGRVNQGNYSLLYDYDALVLWGTMISMLKAKIESSGDKSNDIFEFVLKLQSETKSKDASWTDAETKHLKVVKSALEGWILANPSSYSTLSGAESQMTLAVDYSAIKKMANDSSSSRSFESSKNSFIFQARRELVVRFLDHFRDFSAKPSSGGETPYESMEILILKTLNNNKLTPKDKIDTILLDRKKRIEEFVRSLASSKAFGPFFQRNETLGFYTASKLYGKTELTRTLDPNGLVLKNLDEFLALNHKIAADSVATSFLWGAASWLGGFLYGVVVPAVIEEVVHQGANLIGSQIYQGANLVRSQIWGAGDGSPNELFRNYPVATQNVELLNELQQVGTVKMLETETYGSRHVQYLSPNGARTGPDGCSSSELNDICESLEEIGSRLSGIRDATNKHEIDACLELLRTSVDDAKFAHQAEVEESGNDRNFRGLIQLTNAHQGAEKLLKGVRGEGYHASADAWKENFENNRLEPFVRPEHFSNSVPGFYSATGVYTEHFSSEANYNIAKSQESRDLTDATKEGTRLGKYAIRKMEISTLGLWGLSQAVKTGRLNRTFCCTAADMAVVGAIPILSKLVVNSERVGSEHWSKKRAQDLEASEKLRTSTVDLKNSFRNFVSVPWRSFLMSEALLLFAHHFSDAPPHVTAAGTLLFFGCTFVSLRSIGSRSAENARNRGDSGFLAKLLACAGSSSADAVNLFGSALGTPSSTAFQGAVGGSIFSRAVTVGARIEPMTLFASLMSVLHAIQLANKVEHYDVYGFSDTAWEASGVVLSASLAVTSAFSSFLGELAENVRDLADARGDAKKTVKIAKVLSEKISGTWRANVLAGIAKDVQARLEKMKTRSGSTETERLSMVSDGLLIHHALKRRMAVAANMASLVALFSFSVSIISFSGAAANVLSKADLDALHEQSKIAWKMGTHVTEWLAQNFKTGEWLMKMTGAKDTFDVFSSGAFGIQNFISKTFEGGVGVAQGLSSVSSLQLAVLGSSVLSTSDAFRSTMRLSASFKTWLNCLRLKRDAT